MYHYFFIKQKQTFNVDGTDYDAWVIGSRYYMLRTDPRPDGYTIHNVMSLLASAGGYDMLYIYESKSLLTTALAQPSFAGGGSTYGNAWLDFTIRSYEQVGIHDIFTAGAAARKVITIRWMDGEDIISGTISDWITAGRLEPTLVLGVPLRIYGVE